MYDVLEGKDMKESSARGGGGVCVRVRVRVCFLLLLFFFNADVPTGAYYLAY